MSGTTSKDNTQAGRPNLEQDPAALVQEHYPFELLRTSGAELHDAEYPGTAVIRLAGILKRVNALTDDDLSKDWDIVRGALLWAGGLAQTKETGHAFNDDNHCDMTAMLSSVQNEANASGIVAGISRQNFLGAHITRNTVPIYAGESNTGSWSTCTNGCHKTPPHDVAHVQFSARIAFKMVWCPPRFEKFVLVDDVGRLLKIGRPRGNLPHISYRQSNYDLVQGGVYEEAARRAGQQP